MNVLLIGVDGTSFTLLEKLMKDGRLPVLARLAKEGAFGPLESVIPPDSPTAWSVAYTSLNPGRTGIYGFDKRVGKGFSWRVPNAADRKAKDVWQVASGQGKKVLVMGMPLTFPPRPVNGILVSGHFTTEPKRAVYPSEKNTYILEELGYPIHSNDCATLEEFTASMQKRFEVLEKLLEGGENLVMLGIEQMENACHKFWYKEYDMIPSLYQELDKILEKFLADKEDWLLIIHSDHGHVEYRKHFHVNSWLLSKGYLKTKPKEELEKLHAEKVATEGKSLAHRHGGLKGRLAGFLYPVVAFVRHKMPFVKRLFPFLSTPQAFSVQQEELKESTVDYDQTAAIAYEEGHGNYGGISLNVKGRDKPGFIPENEYKQVRAGVIEALRKEPFVKNVWTREELFSGPFVEEIYDIVFELDKETAVVGFDRDIRKGDFLRTHPKMTQHEMDGMVLVHGPGVKKGSAVRQTLRDVAPTILYALGCSVPEAYEGAVMDVFEQSHLSVHSVKKADIDLHYDVADMVSKEQHEKEQAVIKKQLQGMGYL